MPQATLLLRERSAASLTSAVERALDRKPPLLQFDLRLDSTSHRLDFVMLHGQQSKPTGNAHVPDEGFESDIDTISMLSIDEPEVDPRTAKIEKTQETDSANGSACSDTDEPEHASEPSLATATSNNAKKHESFSLADCSCYTDVRAPEILLFVVRGDTFVFRLEEFGQLQRFYANFSALKAVANQRTYTNLTAKFNLLQRTDCNGITHIEIEKLEPPSGAERLLDSRIISLNTPETNLLALDSKQKRLSGKTWTSTDDLLNAENDKDESQRRKIKPKAPLPPPATNRKDMYDFPTGLTTTYQQFRQNSVNGSGKKRLESWTNSVPRLLRKQRSRSETRGNLNPMAYRYVDTTKENQHLQFQLQWQNQNQQQRVEQKQQQKQLQKQSPKESTLKKPLLFRPKYETIDYATLKSKNGPERATTTISNRLFGMSSKLRDFSSSNNANSNEYSNINNETNNANSVNFRGKNGLGKWSSLGELSHKLNGGATGKSLSLKSVIKKDDTRGKNDKKVTFSAYTTVQVV